MSLRPVLFAAISGVVLAAGLVFWLESRPPQPDRRIVSVAVSSSGRWIAAGTRAGSITVLDRTGPGNSLPLLASAGDLNDLQFSPDERSLAIANRNLSTYAVKGRTLLRALRGDGRNYGTARFSADGRRLLTITGAATIEVMDSNSGETQTSICCSTIYGETGFDPDGTMIVTAGHWPTFWDVQSGRSIRRLTKDREFPTFGPIAFDRRRGWVLAGSQDGRVYSWDLRTGQRTATSWGRADYVYSIAALRDSPWIAYGTLGGPIRLWNPDNGEERQLAGTAATSNLVAGVEPNSIFFGTEAGFVELWDITSSKLSQRYDLR